MPKLNRKLKYNEDFHIKNLLNKVTLKEIMTTPVISVQVAAPFYEVAEKIKNLSIQLYLKGSEYAEKKGIIIADTKFEFGILDGAVILIDEVLTPDSSRFWPKAIYEPGKDQPSFDKQIVRNYLLEIKWNQTPPAPELPREVVEKTSKAYRDVYERLVGKKIN